MALRSGTLSLQTDQCSSHKSNSDMEVEKSPSGSYVHAPIDKFGPTGRWFRHKLLDGILVGTPVLLTIQRHRTKLRTTIMKTMSFLGTEDFYTILFLFLLWSVDSRLGRLFGILMGIGFYTTGFLKTVLCLPRPPCPPIIPLEKAFDWALPSHHSLLGVICPWYIWLYTTLHYDMSTVGMSVVCTLIVLWSFGVLLSRLYLGVHSPADIVCGGITGVLVLSMWMQVDDYIEMYISQPNLEPQLQLFALMVLLLCIHPTTEPGNPSFSDSCVLVGVINGIVFGRSQRSRILGMQAVLETSPDTDAMAFIMIALARVVIGGGIIIALRVGLKLTFSAIFSNLYRLAGLETFSNSEYRKAMAPNPKHYTKDFKLPPIYATKVTRDDDPPANDSTTSTSTTSPSSDVSDSEMTSSKAEAVCEIPNRSWLESMQLGAAVFALTKKPRESGAWDFELPTRFCVYSIITFVGVEMVPRVFTLFGI